MAPCWNWRGGVGLAPSRSWQGGVGVVPSRSRRGDVGFTLSWSWRGGVPVEVWVWVFLCGPVLGVVDVVRGCAGGGGAGEEVRHSLSWSWR